MEVNWITVFIAAFGAFAGYYTSELVRLSLRARNVANQLWAYALNIERTLRANAANDKLYTFAEEWTKLRKLELNKPEAGNQPLLLRLRAVDEKIKSQIEDRRKTPEAREGIADIFSDFKQIPGKLEAQLTSLDMATAQMKEWTTILPDSDTAILGADVVLRVVNVRGLTHQAARGHRAFLLYIKHAPTFKDTEIGETILEWVMNTIDLYRELQELRPVLDKIRRKNLLQLMAAILTPELDFAARAAKVVS